MDNWSCHGTLRIKRPGRLCIIPHFEPSKVSIANVIHLNRIRRYWQRVYVGFDEWYGDDFSRAEAPCHTLSMKPLVSAITRPMSFDITAQLSSRPLDLLLAGYHSVLQSCRVDVPDTLAYDSVALGNISLHHYHLNTVPLIHLFSLDFKKSPWTSGGRFLDLLPNGWSRYVSRHIPVFFDLSASKAFPLPLVTTSSGSI
jgi:hypothetical protein